MTEHAVIHCLDVILLTPSQQIMPITMMMMKLSMMPHLAMSLLLVPLPKRSAEVVTLWAVS